MAHPHVALDVEGWRAGEPEGLHVGVDDRLVHRAGLGPRPLELCDQLLVHWTPEGKDGKSSVSFYKIADKLEVRN